MFEAIGGLFTGIVAIVVVLGACIFFHEVGHFVLAKLVGMKVHEFAIGFGTRLFGFTRGETEYRINLVPLGGYVRIAGMEPGAEPEEGGFYTFPRWQGATVLFAGSFMNVVLAALAFIVVALATGLPVFPGHQVDIRKVMSGSPAQEAGIQPGDQVIAIDGMRHSLLIDSIEEGGLADELGLGRYDRLFMAEGRQIRTTVELARAMIAARSAAGPGEAGEANEAGGSPPTVEVEVLSLTDEGTLSERKTVALPVPEEMPAEITPGEAGPLLEEMLGLTFERMGTDSALGYISARPDERITLTVLREEQQIEIEVVPEREWARVPVEEEGRLASAHEPVGRIGVVLGAQTRPASAAEAVHYGIRNSIDAVVMVAQGIYMMIRGQLAPEAAGPVGIAAMTAESARIGWTAVASLGGIISANLAVINLFPIPPFDGFRIILLGVEGVIRRRVNHKIEMAVTIFGVALLLGLFLVITFRDIFHLVLFQTP